MKYHSTMEACPYVYNPAATDEEIKEPFVVSFENDGEQERRAQRAIAHLLSVDRDQLIDESIQFFKWIVLYHTSECNLKYAERLLEFFHSQGFLQHKSQVNIPQKQQTHRYLVIFTMVSPQREHVFSKTYNSIRELKADTGKKPSQIICKPTSELICELLTK